MVNDKTKNWFAEGSVGDIQAPIASSVDEKNCKKTWRWLGIDPTKIPVMCKSRNNSHGIN